MMLIPIASRKLAYGLIRLMKRRVEDRTTIRVLRILKACSIVSNLYIACMN